MKNKFIMKYLIPILLLLLYSNLLYGQCADLNEPCSINNDNPEIVYNDDLETGQSSLIAYVDNYYQTNFQVNIPTDTTFAVDGFGEVEITIDYFTILEIGGLSATGLELNCSNENCTFNGGESGCFSLSGTPMVSESYTLNLVVYAAGSWNGIPVSQELNDLIEVTLIVEECEIEGCWNDDDFYAINEQYWINNCQYLMCEEDDNWSSIVTLEECIQEVCDTTYIEVTEYVPVWLTDTIIQTEIEYVPVWLTDTIIQTEYITDTIIQTETEYVDIIITEYVDCETFLPCDSGMEEIIDKSKIDGKIYNLMGQEIKRRNGLYIEGGEIKYRLY